MVRGTGLRLASEVVVAMTWQVAARLLGQYALVRRAGYPEQEKEAFLDAAYAAFDPDDPSGWGSDWGIIGELRSWRRNAPSDPLLRGRVGSPLRPYCCCPNPRVEGAYSKERIT